MEDWKVANRSDRKRVTWFIPTFSYHRYMPYSLLVRAAPQTFQILDVHMLPILHVPFVVFLALCDLRSKSSWLLWTNGF